MNGAVASLMMNRTKQLHGLCSECGGPLRFPAESIGLITACPHCGKQTELSLPAPADENVISKRTLIWTLVAVIILGLGLAGAFSALKRAERWAAAQKHPAAGMEASGITLQKSTDGSPAQVLGTLQNTSGQERSEIRIEIDLLDGSGATVGKASGFKHSLGAGQQWQFKIPVPDPKAVGARLKQVTAR